jgi:hypothetical protein
MVKETVIIVHGTWSAPEAGSRRWYQRFDEGSSATGFTNKLDAALQKRGSPARCWAHCAPDDPIFQWSGENSWVARAAAASALVDYVTTLKKDGWLCHVVAHSHGGNIVVEALQQFLREKPPLQEYIGKIVTLGTPFMDSMSPIIKKSRRTQESITRSSWILLGITLFSMLISILAGHRSPVGPDLVYVIFMSTFIFLIFGLPLLFFSRKLLDKFTLKRAAHDNHSGGQPLFLAMGSCVDEAWQILFHLRNSNNQFAVKSNIIVFLILSLRTDIQLHLIVDRLHGAKTYRDIGWMSKIVLSIAHCVSVLVFCSTLYGIKDFYKLRGFFSPAQLIILYTLPTVIFFSIPFLIVLLLAKFLGPTFYSAFLSPFRWLRHLAGSPLLLGQAIATYFVRVKSWSVLLKLIMGLEGYRFAPPSVERYPTTIPEQLVRFENMPKRVEETALDKRTLWISSRLVNVSEVFSNLVLTAADLTSLLQMVEADQTLVHGAYYTDDECIGRIADWIAGRG